MDLTRWLLRCAAGRPHVLIVPSRGGTAVRLAVEAELARRGWPTTVTPADADVLLVAGTPGRELSTAIDALWTAVPQPRARSVLDGPDDVGAALDRAAADLAAGVGSATRSTSGRSKQDGTATDVRASEHGPGAREQHGDHGGHGDTEMPGGLPMADLGEDRDGLMLDRLRVALGPVLPGWPAGLVAEVTLQGDVIQDAELRLVDDPVAEPFWPRERTASEGAELGHDDRNRGDEPGQSGRASELRRAVARELDALARLLAVAGWKDPATRARRLRDELLDDGSVDIAGVAAADLSRKVARSRTLRRMLRGLSDVPALVDLRLAALDSALRALTAPTTTGRRLELHGTPGAVAGATVGGRSRLGLAELEQALVGVDLAVARLLVAAADPDTEREAADPRSADTAHTGHEVQHDTAGHGAHDG